MADNLFDPKYPMGGLLGMFATPPAQEPDNPLARGLGLLGARPFFAVSPLSAAASDLFPNATMPRTNPPNNLTGLAAVNLFQPFGLLAPPRFPVAPIKAAVKRKAFFSFHFDDSFRVNAVRNSWKIHHPSSEAMRSFQDSSLWERRKLTDPKAVKAVIRYGVTYTSAVCVLVGTETWSRPWVRYEIARAIIDGKGLLAVHLNNIRHHETLTTHPLGRNPLDYMAIGKVQPNLSQPANYFLFEKLAVPDAVGGYQWGWIKYKDHTDAVGLPAWVTDPPVGEVTPLSDNAHEYDFMRDVGHEHIGSWLDRAAQRAGR